MYLEHRLQAMATKRVDLEVKRLAVKHGIELRLSIEDIDLIEPEYLRTDPVGNSALDAYNKALDSMQSIDNLLKYLDEEIVAVEALIAAVPARSKTKRAPTDGAVPVKA